MFNTEVNWIDTLERGIGVSVISYLVSTCVSLSIHVSFAIPKFSNGLLPIQFIECGKPQHAIYSTKWEMPNVICWNRNDQWTFQLPFNGFLLWLKPAFLSIILSLPPCVLLYHWSSVVTIYKTIGLEKLASQNGKHK